MSFETIFKRKQHPNKIIKYEKIYWTCIDNEDYMFIFDEESQNKIDKERYKNVNKFENDNFLYYLILEDWSLYQEYIEKRLISNWNFEEIIVWNAKVGKIDEKWNKIFDKDFKDKIKLKSIRYVLIWLPIECHNKDCRKSWNIDITDLKPDIKDDFEEGKYYCNICSEIIKPKKKKDTN